MNSQQVKTLELPLKLEPNNETQTSIKNLIDFLKNYLETTTAKFFLQHRKIAEGLIDFLYEEQTPLEDVAKHFQSFFGDDSLKKIGTYLYHVINEKNRASFADQLNMLLADGDVLLFVHFLLHIHDEDRLLGEF